MRVLRRDCKENLNLCAESKRPPCFWAAESKLMTGITPQYPAVGQEKRSKHFVLRACSAYTLLFGEGSGIVGMDFCKLIPSFLVKRMIQTDEFLIPLTDRPFAFITAVIVKALAGFHSQLSLFKLFPQQSGYLL